MFAVQKALILKSCPHDYVVDYVSGNSRGVSVAQWAWCKVLLVKPAVSKPMTLFMANEHSTGCLTPGQALPHRPQQAGCSSLGGDH